MIRNLDDSGQVVTWEKAGAAVVKGAGRLAGRTPDGLLRVEVDGQVLEGNHVVVSTGSEPARPPVEGLDDVPVWTNREATTLTDIPGRVVVLGDSAVAVEIGQFLGRMGAGVTMVERGDRLASREDPASGTSHRRAVPTTTPPRHPERLGCTGRARRRSQPRRRRDRALHRPPSPHPQPGPGPRRQ
jgi:pyruvate/2-oxoglutarate dehydrogenase complex dihydrolipoamide dehydrogenase (E3) component